MLQQSSVTIAIAAVLALGSANPSLGQSHTSAVGLTFGGSVHSNLTPGLPGETRFESGWIVGLQYEYWIGTGRAGLRANTLFTQRLLETVPGGDYNVIMADIGLMFRVLPVQAHRVIVPFVSLGLGATHYGSVAGSGPLAGGVYGENVVRPHLLATVGADVASSGPVGIRLELGDEIVFPSVGYSPSFSGLPNVHNLIATGAIQYRMGGGLPVAYPTTAPAPEPQPTPQKTQPGPEVDPDGAGAPPTRSVVDSLRTVVDSLEARAAAMERQVDSLQARTVELERQTAADLVARDDRAVYTVQVSAFLDSDRADGLAAELQADGIPTWRWDAVTRNRTFSRVRVGALPTRAAAERLARFLNREKGLSFWVDRIDPVEDVPADAVRGTREYLESQDQNP